MLHVTRLLSGSKLIKYKGRRGRDRMVVGLTTTCAISANYHHSGCEFESRLWRVVFGTT
jgi:hypothetical protein